VGVGEEDAPLGEPVKVGGLYIRMAAEASGPVVEVVNGHKKHVGLFG